MTHTLVLDIGKSNAKLLLLDARGELLASQVQANAAVPGPGYLALGTQAITDWLLRAVPQLPERASITHISISTHGAAFCAINSEGLVLPPMDYEWDGYSAFRLAFAQATDPFAVTGSPALPMGLNAGLQLYWLQQTRPDDWRRIRHWLPYPQYWAWWFSDVAASEATSLGCHTHLWSPAQADFAPWARRSGIAALFAPLRHAWEVLGAVRPELAVRLGLPANCQVHVGVHDSNACLARHLHALPGAVVLSTGTWCVAMAPGVPARGLAPEHDQLVNVSVEGSPVPTARFMGGREFAALCAGADPALATTEALEAVLQQGWGATPCFSDAGGPFQGQVGTLWHNGLALEEGIAAVPSALRPALAALYCADMSAELVNGLVGNRAVGAAENTAAEAPASVVLEGPLATNAAYLCALSAMLQARAVLRSTDEMEGTARGAWMLADWPARATLAGWHAAVPEASPVIQRRVRDYRRWRQGVMAPSLWRS